jgi:hypothetical protein
VQLSRGNRTPREGVGPLPGSLLDQGSPPATYLLLRVAGAQSGGESLGKRNEETHVS